MTEQMQNQKLDAAMVTYLEIPTLLSKKEETAKFYGEVFGWQISYELMSGYGITTNTKNKVTIGLPLLEEITHPLTSFHVQVTDIEKTLETAKKLGGRIVSKRNIISEDIGFGAKFRDPSGNEVGLFQPHS